MVRVNYQSIRRKVANSKKLESIIQAKAKEKFEHAKENFINNFEDHPVTTEIEDGPDASNKSNTLGGIGNLFSFIGFNKEENPISNIKTYIQGSFDLSKPTKSVSGSKIKFNRTQVETFKKSRSGSGLQIENELRSGNFKTTSYMSEIIRKFINTFKS